MSSEQDKTTPAPAQPDPASETTDTRPPIVRQMWEREAVERRPKPIKPLPICPMKDETYREAVGARYVFSMGVMRGSESSMLVEAMTRAVEEFRWAEAFFLADRLDEITGRAEDVEWERAQRERRANVIPPWECPEVREAPQSEPPQISDESRRIAAIIEEKRRRWRGCA